MELDVNEYRKVRANVFREIRASGGITSMDLAEKLNQEPIVVLKAIGDLKEAGWIDEKQDK